MRDRLKKILTYILRSWRDEPEPPHPRLKFIPPFLLELLYYLLALAILYQAVVYLWKLV